jgi:probable F420-dependent oxidoreductase
MKIGLVFPQTEIGNDPAVIRDYAQTAEELGFSHIMTYEHVLGANPNGGKRFRGPYSHEDPFHEPFALFSYLAGFTQRIGLVTGILVLPQRQTALVAKQAATLDILSRGRLRLGVGVGWNRLEFEALGENFRNRGKRIEEQVRLLRQLWTRALVEFDGQWHKIPDAGINPLPIQQPIPVWFGGRADVVLRRAAKMADGFMLNYSRPAEGAEGIRKLTAYLDESRRDKSAFGIETRLAFSGKAGDPWLEEMKEWERMGCTHAAINTMRQGFDSPRDHIELLHKIAQQLGISA